MGILKMYKNLSKSPFDKPQSFIKSFDRARQKQFLILLKALNKMQ